MAMILNDEQSMLKDAAKGFLASSAPISQLRQLRDDENAEGFDRATWKEMADLGWTGVLAAEEFGGVEMGFVAAGVVAEEMGRTLTASPFLSTAVMGVTALSKFGTDAQKQEYLPKIVSGDMITAIAVDEGTKHAPGNVGLTAARSGNGFKLSGTKRFVADGMAADMVLVSARTSGEADEETGVTLFWVPRDAAGVSFEAISTIDSRPAANITLSDVEVTADAVLGEVDQGAGPLEEILSVGRAGLAAEMSGSAQECLDQTVAYLRDRKQFGQTIGSFQGLQHRAAHLFSEIEIGKSIVLKALQALDQDIGGASLFVTAAKAKLGEVAQLAAQEAIQMHGGVGMTDEFDIGFFIKRVRVAEALYGDSNYHTDKFAKMRKF